MGALNHQLSDARLAEKRIASEVKAEYESTLNMTESRYRDAVNREKSKLDTITSENDQLRKIISSNDYRSPGIGTLTSTVEGHLSRFTSKVDELRQDLSAPRVSATPRSQSPVGGFGVSPGREMPLLSTTSSAARLGASTGVYGAYSPAKSSVGASTRLGGLGSTRS